MQYTKEADLTEIDSTSFNNIDSDSTAGFSYVRVKNDNAKTALETKLDTARLPNVVVGSDTATGFYSNEAWEKAGNEGTIPTSEPVSYALPKSKVKTDLIKAILDDNQKSYT